MAHSIHVKAFTDDDGRAWMGVGVCKSCQPDKQVRRTFDVDGNCPHCNQPGEIEWRYVPDLVLPNKTLDS